MSGDPVARSDRFDEQMRGNPLGAWLVKMARRNRAMIWVIAIVVVMVLALTVWVTIVALGAKDTAHKADAAARQATSAKANLRALCLALNASRKDQRKLWNYVLTFPPPVDETPAAREARLEATVKFKAFVDKVFKPRDCSNPQPVHVPPPYLPHQGGAASNPPDQEPAGQAASAPTEAAPARGTSPRPKASSSPAPKRSQRSPSPSSSPSPSPHPIRSCLHHPVKCLPLDSESGAAGTGSRPSTGGIVIIAAASIAAVVASVWWHYRRVSARFRAPPGRTLRRSAD